MNRQELEKLILEKYNVVGDCPWAKYPEYKVFRHADTKKWFAVAMTIPRCKLGLSGDGSIDVVNLKCGEEILFSMLDEGGVFPAYHMAKGSWVSVALDGSASDENICFILGVSYELTKSKKGQK